MESKRWKGTTHKERQAIMSKVAHARHAKLSEAQRKAIGRTLRESRGHWEGKGKNRVYVRKVKENDTVK